MAIDFPNTPEIGDIFSAENSSWVWTGEAWDSYGPTFVSIKTVTESYTLISSDKDKMIEINSSSENTLTIPTDSENFVVGSQVHIIQMGTGQTQVVPDSGVTVVGTPGLFLRDQYSAATLIKRASNYWTIMGDLNA